METLHQQLQQGDRVAISAIAGMGGVGKTELAIQYAHAYKGLFEGGICWFYAREQNIVTQIVGYAMVQLGLYIPDGLEPSDRVAYCWRNWREGDVLIVLDDVVNYQEIKPYLPPEEKRFKVLMTTRLKFGKPIKTLPLGVLKPEQSLELLESFIGQERILAEEAVAQTLCEWLGHLPLGIELVGRYLEDDETLSLAEILFRLQQKAKQRKSLEDESLESPDPDTNTMTAERGVKAAFELSWEVLDPDSQHLGKLLCLFALAPIEWELIEKVERQYCQEEGTFQENVLKKSRKTLLKFHLVRGLEQNRYQLHSLIREFFRGKLEGEPDVTVSR
ncbi:NB-ARC domain-containing protein [Spirulina sp. 06S082]|uniref:NB-ARC domain-containing protein n=1 Tax=Spirulina sp. 06S082 TaxID=3110248 RepID=UPI002B21E5AA|nr:NB-ARC domain-containing protein [Spirulina sp. 06S082]MEA5468533.1 NB-ARC domain-containing protein [Spirulina sp. 06S082]